MHSRLSVLAVLIAMSLPAWAEATDLMLRQRTTITGKTEESVQYWTKSQMVADSPQVRTIIDLDAKTVTKMNKSQKAYQTTTLDKAREIGEKWNRDVANMSPQFRKMLGLDSALTLEATGKTEKIAGYETKEYKVEGGKVSGSVWIAEDIDLGPNGEELKKRLAELGGSGRSGGRVVQELAKIKGLPLRKSLRMSPGNQRITSNTEVVEVAAKSPPPDMLKIPDGFKSQPTISATP